jgi:3-isopropylmalate dehydrogenase
MIVSGQMLLAWLGRKKAEPRATAAAAKIGAAVDAIMLDTGRLTPDLGGSGTTDSVADLVTLAMRP